MNDKELLKEARIKFPEAVSDIEAVDLLHEQTRKDAMKIENDFSEEFKEAAYKISRLKILYKTLFHNPAAAA